MPTLGKLPLHCARPAALEDMHSTSIDVELQGGGPVVTLTNDEARHLRRQLGRALAAAEKKGQG